MRSCTRTSCARRRSRRRRTSRTSANGSRSTRRSRRAGPGALARAGDSLHRRHGSAQERSPAGLVRPLEPDVHDGQRASVYGTLLRPTPSRTPGTRGPAGAAARSNARLCLDAVGTGARQHRLGRARRSIASTSLPTTIASTRSSPARSSARRRSRRVRWAGRSRSLRGRSRSLSGPARLLHHLRRSEGNSFDATGETVVSNEVAAQPLPVLAAGESRASTSGTRAGRLAATTGPSCRWRSTSLGAFDPSKSDQPIQYRDTRCRRTSARPGSG